MRTGIGYDLHRLIPTTSPSSIPLGGVSIPCFFEVDAHSDGDVLLHAIVDACLGALALGDIGQRYPDNKAENRARPSSEFVKETIEEIHRLGWVVEQIDTILFLEEPKVAPHADAIRRQVAQLLKVELSAVSVKAKTMEGLGPIGERKALAAQAVVTLSCPSKSPTP
jgi:2-C-methyl-D-erythritol 2,4-cyclodiphosphate synthase